jgi:hypothetical protein
MKVILGILFYILIFSLSSCVQKEKSKYDELYDIIDILLRFNYYDVDLVILNLKENQEYFVDMEIPEIVPDSISRYYEPPSPPPSIEYTFYYKFFFTQLHHLSLIDSVDVDYMYKQLQTKEQFILDSTRIERMSITHFEYGKLKEKYGSEDVNQIVDNKSNTQSYIVLSVPIISKNKKKLLIEIEYHCGELCGSCTQYLFEKVDGKWKIKYLFGKWIS